MIIKRDIAVKIKHALSIKGALLLVAALIMFGISPLFVASAHAQQAQSGKALLFSKGVVRLNGIKPKSIAQIEVENNGKTYQATANKNGEVTIIGEFPEYPERGISSGVNYTVKYFVPYRNEDDRRRDLENTITLSFSALAGDVLIIGRASDTALVEYTTGTSELKNITASTSGIFRSGAIENTSFKKKKRGSALLIITNTNPESGDPLPPVYIEAGFSIASDPADNKSLNGAQRAFESFSSGRHVFTDSGLQNSWGDDLYKMTQQFSANLMMQAAAVGAILDGYSHEYTKRAISTLQAEAGHRYKPSVNMCKFPSLGKGIARASLASRSQAQIFSKYWQDYNMMQANSAGGNFKGFTHQEYVDRFRENYCHDQQNGPDGLSQICTSDSNKDRVNHDINYPYFFENREGLKINLTDNVLTDGEIDLFNLTHNLFSPTYKQIKESIIRSNDGERAITETRALQAIRSVAKNSFANQVGRHAGTMNQDKALINQVKNLMMNIGASEANLDEYWGIDASTSLSYDATMEVLTKKLYQDPAFYANLYDNPENVMRQKAAMKAIQLMQGWDVVKALHRREMLLAMMVEVKARQVQRKVETNIE